MRIDLNSDLGEHFGAWRMSGDEEMLDIVTSANVACGFHAGDPQSIRSTIRAAATNGVAIGAHVSYPDLVGFGRRKMDIAAAELEADVIYQIGALQAIAKAEGTRVSYVKPHGALYNTIAEDPVQAAAVIDAVLTVDASLPIVVLAASGVVAQVRAAGLRAVSEVFADRSYEPSGALTSREIPGAVLSDPEVAAERMLRLLREGTIEARDGSIMALEADSICVHGDSTGAVRIAIAVRDQLTRAGFLPRPFVDV